MDLKINRIGYWFCALISVIASVALLTSCSASSGDNGGEGLDNITVSTKSLSFTANGGRKSLTVNCSKQWLAHSEEDWHKVYVSGNMVWVTVDPNTTGQIRSGHVSVKCGNKEELIEIYQEKNSSVNPYEGIEYTLTENYNTCFLPDDVTKAFVSVNDNEKTFVVNPGVAAPSAGDQVIINNLPEYFPNGRIIRITEVTNVSQGYRIKYQDIGLTDVFTTLKLDETTLDIAKYVSYIENANGDPVDFIKKRTRAGIGRYQIEIPQEGWEISSAKVTPKMNIGLLLKTDLDIENSKITKFDVAADADIVMDADFKLENSERDIDFKKKFLKIFFKAVPVGPILITPYIEVTGIFNACGKTSLVATLKYNTHLNSEMHYANGTTLNGSLNLTKPDGSISAKYGNKIEGEAKYGLSLDPTVKVYDNALKMEAKSTLLWNENLNIDGQDVKFPGFVAQDTEDINWAERMMNADFTTSLNAEGSCNISGKVSSPLTYNMTNVKQQIETRKVIPTVSKYYTANRNGQEVEFKTAVSNKAAVYYDKLILRLNDGTECDFSNWGTTAITKLEQGADSVTITARVTRENTARIQAQVLGEIDGKIFPIRKY